MGRLVIPDRLDRLEINEQLNATPRRGEVTEAEAPRAEPSRAEPREGKQARRRATRQTFELGCCGCTTYTDDYCGPCDVTRLLLQLLLPPRQRRRSTAQGQESSGEGEGVAGDPKQSWSPKSLALYQFAKVTSALPVTARPIVTFWFQQLASSSGITTLVIFPPQLDFPGPDCHTPGLGHLWNILYRQRKLRLYACCLLPVIKILRHFL